MAEHVEIGIGEIHICHDFTYADATAREAASLASTDVGKIAKQTDNNSYWVLVSQTGPIWVRMSFGHTINAQTGTTYTVLAKDRGKLVTHSNGSATAVTLPQASSTGFGADWSYLTVNLGAGAVTITPTTSTINGAATLVLNQNEAAIIVSDGTNYKAIKIQSAAGGAGGFAASGANADITSMTGLTGSLRAPTQILDTNGNEVVKFTATASAVNEVTITNKATGTGPTIEATGGDTNINLNLVSKGTGVVQANGLSVATSDTVQTLTDGATVTWATGGVKYPNATVTLGGNRTLAITGAVSGQSGVLVVKQDATGSRTLTLPASSKVRDGGAGAITLTTTANAIDILTYFYDGTNYFWTYAKNYS